MLRKFALLFLAMTMPAVAFDINRQNCEPPPPSWHLLTKSYGGTISLLKNLTKDECEFARARAFGLPATEEEKKEAKRRTEIEFPKCVVLYQSESGSSPRNIKIWEEWKRANPEAKGCTGPGGTATIWNSTTHMVNDGDIETAECFE
jgi:hypothetical protein